MAIKHHAWKDAKLDEHSKRKHKILREYFRQYLITRCRLPQREKFRLAVIDAFADGGKYSCGSYGSPLIFIEELKNSLVEINIGRATKAVKNSALFYCLHLAQWCYPLPHHHASA